MKKLLAAAVIAGAALACGKAGAPGYSTASGSLALSRDGALLYAADTDNAILAVIDRKALSVVATVTVGAGPERVIVGPDDVIYVSNRGNRSVSIIRRGTWQEAARLPVGVEPAGLAISPDGKTLYVVNSTTLASPAVGSVMAFDTASQQLKWEQVVGEEPRGIRVVDANTAAVTLSKTGDVAFIHLDDPSQTPRLLGSNAQGALYEQLNGSVNPSAVSTFHSRNMMDLTLSPDGKSLFVPTTFAREDAIAFPPSVSGGYYAHGGPCNLGAIATPGLMTIDTQTQTPKVDSLTDCSFSSNTAGKDYPPTTLAPPSAGLGTPIQGANVAVVDSTGSWIYVVNRESNNVAILPASRSNSADPSLDVSGTTVRDLVQVGRAPNGIALAHDGTAVYVYNQFDHTLSVLVEDRTQPQAVVRELTDSSGNVQRLTVAGDPPGMSADVLRGRSLFFDATDARMNNPNTGVSCASCHVEGREDGQTWFFPDGKRQTPSLAGRMILQTAPFHWSGAFADFGSFLDHTVQARMGGSGIGNAEQAELEAYISALALPDNATSLAAPTAQQVRGAQVFAAANCGSCHGGLLLTNNGFANVGSLTVTDQIDPAKGLNVPSLLGLGRTAPYLHDGSALTLKDRVLSTRDSANPNEHGNLAGVTDAQVDDLVAYLQSL